MLELIIKAVVEALFRYLDSLVQRKRAEQEIFEKGQREVHEALDRKEKEIAAKLEERRKASTDTSFDDAIRELLDSASDKGSNPVHSNNQPANGSNSKTK